jgi:protein-tyrosine-phosphatase
MNILFVCKHNIFRSRVAESYFNQINKNSSIKASSAGLIPGIGMTAEQNKIANIQMLTAKKFGINMKFNPKALSVGLLKEQDLVIIVADDIPIKIFNNKHYIKKMIFWKIPDVPYDNTKDIEKTIKRIIKRVNKLNRELK